MEIIYFSTNNKIRICSKCKKDIQLYKPFYHIMIQADIKPTLCVECYLSKEEAKMFPSWMGNNPRMNSPWTDQEEAELLRSYKEGCSISDLALKHGRKEGGILSRLESTYPDIRVFREANQEIEQLKKRLDEIISKANELKVSFHNTLRR